MHLCRVHNKIHENSHEPHIAACISHGSRSAAHVCTICCTPGLNQIPINCCREPGLVLVAFQMLEVHSRPHMLQCSLGYNKSPQPPAAACGTLYCTYLSLLTGCLPLSGCESPSDISGEPLTLLGNRMRLRAPDMGFSLTSSLA